MRYGKYRRNFWAFFDSPPHMNTHCRHYYIKSLSLIETVSVNPLPHKMLGPLPLGK